MAVLYVKMVNNECIFTSINFYLSFLSKILKTYEFCKYFTIFRFLYQYHDYSEYQAVLLISISVDNTRRSYFQLQFEFTMPNNSNRHKIY